MNREHELMWGLLQGAPAGCKIGIVGSRNYRPLSNVMAVVMGVPEGCIIVSGGGGRVDNYAVEVAWSRGLQYKVYCAEWDRYGIQAGHIRNGLIAKCGLWCLVAFSSCSTGLTPGTKSVANKALKQGVRVIVIN